MDNTIKYVQDSKNKELVEYFIKRSNKIHINIYPLHRALANSRLFLIYYFPGYLNIDPLILLLFRIGPSNYHQQLHLSRIETKKQAFRHEKARWWHCSGFKEM